MSGGVESAREGTPAAVVPELFAAVVGRDRDGDLASMNGEGGDREPRRTFEVSLYDPRREVARVTVHSQATYLGPMRTATVRVR